MPNNWDLLNGQTDPYQIQAPEPIPDYVAPAAETTQEQPKSKWRKFGEVMQKLTPALIAGWGLVNGNPIFAASALDKYHQLESEQDQKEEREKQQKFAAAQWQNALEEREAERMRQQTEDSYRKYKDQVETNYRKEQDEKEMDYKNRALEQEREIAGLRAATSSRGSDRGNVDLSRQYQGVINSYKQYQDNVKNRRFKGAVTPDTTPMSLEGWLRQPGREGSLDIYNQFTGNSLSSLEFPYGKKPKQSGNTDKYVSQNKGVAKAMINLWEQIPQNEMQALMDRYNRNNKTSYTLQKFKELYIDKKTSGKGNQNLASR